MPYAKNGDVNINYKLAGEGIPLVLVHGGTANLTLWRQYGYIDALTSDYQLISIDLRGHGQSDKPHDHASYSHSKLETDVITVLNDLGLDKSHYLGFSTGALLGFHLAVNHPEKFSSFTLIGMNPLSFPEATINTVEWAITSYKKLATEPEEFIKEAEKTVNRKLNDTEKTRVLSMDGEALVAFMEAQIEWPKPTEKDLSEITLPCLIIAGELDPHGSGSEYIAGLIPDSHHVSLPGLDHMQSWESSEVTLPHIKEFLARVSSG